MEMIEIAPYSPRLRAPTGVRPTNNRSRISNRPRRMAIDGRSQLGRRLHDLAQDFAAQLGGWPGLSDTAAANVRRAAELTALAEQKRAEALQDGSVDPVGLVRLEGAAGRAVRALGLKPAAQRRPERTLDQYLADTADQGRDG
jgi:hypothetical protein